MNDDAQSLEFLEIAVNRREVDVGRNDLNLFGEFFSGAVGTLFEETAQQDPSRGRGATAAFAQEIQDLFDSVNFGLGFVADILGG
jgi:hypothetical protein